MDKSVTVETHAHQINYLLRVLAHTQADLTDLMAGRKITYNVDFSLLCPLLFDRPGHGSKRFLPDVDRWMPRVLARGSTHTPYRLVISGATFYEFLDQLVHQSDRLRNQFSALHSLDAEKVLRDDGWWTTSRLKDQLRDQLALLTDGGYEATVREPIRRLRHLLDSGSLEGLGDLGVKPSAASTRGAITEFHRLLEEQGRVRGGRDFGERTSDDAWFHYRIDAANVCLSRIVAREHGEDFRFVTPTDINLRQADRLGRLDRVPLYLSGVLDLEYAGHVASSNRFLREAIVLGVSLVEDLVNYKELDNLPRHTVKTLDDFYVYYVAQLESVATSEGREKKCHEDLETIRQTLRNPKRLQERMEAAVSEIRQSSRELANSYADRLDTSYIEHFDFSEDPVFQRIKTELSL